MPKAKKLVTLNAAKALLRILQELGIKGALQGGVASEAYGASGIETVKVSGLSYYGLLRSR